MLENLKARAVALKAETYAVYIAARDPRTPLLAKVIILIVVAYVVSPIDLIPDFIPVVGYLDDMIIVSVGIALALRMIPPQVMEEARKTARIQEPSRTLRIVGAGIIVLIWILAIIGLTSLTLHLLRKAP